MFTVAAGDTSLVYRQKDLTGNAAALLQAAGSDDQSIQVDAGFQRCGSQSTESEA